MQRRLGTKRRMSRSKPPLSETVVVRGVVADEPYNSRIAFVVSSEVAAVVHVAAE